MHPWACSQGLGHSLVSGDNSLLCCHCLADEERVHHHPRHRPQAAGRPRFLHHGERGGALCHPGPARPRHSGLDPRESPSPGTSLASSTKGKGCWKRWQGMGSSLWLHFCLWLGFSLWCSLVHYSDGGIQAWFMSGSLPKASSPLKGTEERFR